MVTVQSLRCVKQNMGHNPDAGAHLGARWEECRRRVEAALDAWLPGEDELPPVLHRAMRYAVFAGGKRLRPLLVLESCRVLAGEDEHALPAACAVEAVHTHSLVHDDLPCMDDDDLRRGKPTCHKVFGEGMAVLCGDSLLTFAFDLLATRLPQAGVEAGTVVRCVAELAGAASSRELGGGQALDLEAQAGGYAEPGRELVLQIHQRKTAALMRACCGLGGLLGGAAEAELKALRDFGHWLGLAFQITDDILDVTGSAELLGKTVGKDERQRKLTYPMVFGLERSRALAAEAVETALGRLERVGQEARLLRELAISLLDRQG